MTSFEYIGCERLDDVYTAEGAHRVFESSCRICTNRGLRIDCDRCAIKDKFSIVMEAIKVRESEPIKDYIERMKNEGGAA